MQFIVMNFRNAGQCGPHNYSWKKAVSETVAVYPGTYGVDFSG